MRLFSKRRRILIATLVLVLVSGATAVAVARGTKKPKKKKGPLAPEPVAVVDFEQQVKPILQSHCWRCHGPARSEAGLRLDTVAGIRKGGDSGGIVIPGDGARSLLVTVLNGVEERSAMPPNGEPLSDEQIALIKSWIDGGAVGQEEGADAGKEPMRPLGHWAFQAPVALPVPGAGHPVDAFLTIARRERGLTPGPAAPPATLARRVYLDLVGVPPTREELGAFLADPSPEAYGKMVDRLLADPRHGERWGRHWMDVWRYAEADGRKAKADIWWSSQHLWRWRDWIIRSLNEDKGYDWMVVEMLAGDEVDPSAAAATGFLVRNWFKLDRDIWLSNTVEHTGKAFLGLSIGCARCHDHKFDPISQREYYRFRSHFESHDIRTEPMPGESGDAGHISRAFEHNPDARTWLYVRGDPKSPDKSIPITSGVPEVLGRAEPGRRMALARWIANRANPLTARVAVNHIWMRHFHQPFVENVADFGTRTPAPPLLPLLDWLATDFMEHGWSMKRLHRLIVTSDAYRLHSSMRGAAPSNIANDSENRFLWRANAGRMEAEVVRDSLLWLGGALEPAMGGPPIDPARGDDTGRRTLYYRLSREDKLELLTVFDGPRVEECYRRERSIIPQQALALANSRFAWDQARRITRRLEATAADDFVTAAFEHVLGRAPSSAEASESTAFLASQTVLLADPSRLTPLPPVPHAAPVDPEVAKRVPGLPLVLGKAKSLPHLPPAADPAARAREYLVHALLNHNDFITIR